MVLRTCINEVALSIYRPLLPLPHEVLIDQHSFLAVLEGIPAFFFRFFLVGLFFQDQSLNLLVLPFLLSGAPVEMNEAVFH